MFAEIWHNLQSWSELNSAVALTGAMAAMSCALPGVWLVLRRHSMMADALAHAALPGVVGAFLATAGFEAAGWISAEKAPAILHTAVIIGAVLAGLLTAWLTEAVQKLGRIDSGAALGVVFTCLFALGLILIRLFADNVHLDPDCVLFGVLEASVLDTVSPASWVPRAAVANAIAFGINLVLMLLFFKELRIAAFDAELARAQGIPAGILHYALLAATAVAAATAFTTVGSILVIGLLIVPAATAQMMTQRLWMMMLVSVALAGLWGLLGHAVAMSVPGPVFSRLGFTAVRDASTAGTIAVVGGVGFVIAIFTAPRTGLFTQTLDRLRISLHVLSDDILGLLYRREEAGDASLATASALAASSPWLGQLARLRLRSGGLIRKSATRGYELTDAGRGVARSLVRSHRLWETYLDHNFPLPPDQLHLAADRAEHYLDPTLREALAAEGPQSERDPHGRKIPDTNDPTAPPR